MSIHSIQLPLISSTRAVLLGFVGTLIALVAFSDPLMQLVHRWATQEEYSHGFLIPIVTVWLFWVRRADTASKCWPAGLDRSNRNAARNHYAPHRPNECNPDPFAGCVCGGAHWLNTEFGRIFIVSGGISFRYCFCCSQFRCPAFLILRCLFDCSSCHRSSGRFSLDWLESPCISTGMSSIWAYYQVQVVEACSGLRYIYPLLSLSFLAAYFFKAPLWQRALVFFSVVPIAIVMNSIRIGLVGVTVNYWGTQAADGVLHFFEGWFVFLMCACILVLEIYLLARIVRKPFFDVFALPRVTSKVPQGPSVGAGNQAPVVASLALLCVTAVAALHISARSEIIPDRPRFVAFPRTNRAVARTCFIARA